MTAFKSFFRILWIATVIMMLSICCDREVYAGSKIFRGVKTSITLDKSCKEGTEDIEIVLVFDGEPESESSGWFYGKGTSSAEFRSISTLQYEVIYPVTRYHKLPPSHMELQRVKDGFQAVIRDHIPEDQELRESVCYYEKMVVNLKPIKESADIIKTRAKELFSAELLMTEGSDIVFNQKDYRAAEAKGYKALAILERMHGKLSKEALDASALIAFALTGLERFDEALEAITPYRKALPENADLKEFEEILQQLKKEQDELFRYDPDSKSDVELEPLA